MEVVISTTAEAGRAATIVKSARRAQPRAFRSAIDTHAVRSNQADSKMLARIESLLRQELDWEYVFERAKQNFVTPLLCRNLIDNFAESIPCDILIRLENYLHLHTLSNLRLTRELLEITSLLESHDISVLAFKGPTLSLLAYGDLALRQFSDLDVLVQ
ncbi:MAG: nucleotidyltransferase family protein, partial [Pyrinomonadaceae bacterium]